MRILVLAAHPRPSTSLVQRAMTAAARSIPGITVHDLYAAYPDFGIDAGHEQQLLLDHDLVVFQHPFYWYSSPAILKEWQDIVLDFGWAYGPDGKKLHGKIMLQAISTGGAEDYYSRSGSNRFTVEELLRPFNQTAYLCGMAYLEPFIIYEGRRMGEADMQRHISSYHTLLTGLAQGALKPTELLAKDFTLPAGFNAVAAS
jgi:glutathione-regulated potassium-efflux system ancillary protein KefG